MDATSTLKTSEQPKIRYKSGYKYQLAEEYRISTPILNQSIDDDYLALLADGTLIMRRGYAWDGPSGPTIDTKNFMRGSIVHDALYQLIRDKKIDHTWKDTADQMLHDLCIEDGMCSFRAWCVLKGVQMGGDASTKGEPYPILEAP